MLAGAWGTTKKTAERKAVYKINLKHIRTYRFIFCLALSAAAQGGTTYFVQGESAGAHPHENLLAEHNEE